MSSWLFDVVDDVDREGYFPGLDTTHNESHHTGFAFELPIRGGRYVEDLVAAVGAIDDLPVGLFFTADEFDAKLSTQ